MPASPRNYTANPSNKREHKKTERHSKPYAIVTTGLELRARKLTRFGRVRFGLRNDETAERCGPGFIDWDDDGAFVFL